MSTSSTENNMEERPKNLFSILQASNVLTGSVEKTASTPEVSKPVPMEDTSKHLTDTPTDPVATPLGSDVNLTEPAAAPAGSDATLVVPVSTERTIIVTSKYSEGSVIAEKILTPIPKIDIHKFLKPKPQILKGTIIPSVQNKENAKITNPTMVVTPLIKNEALNVECQPKVASAKVKEAAPIVNIFKLHISPSYATELRNTGRVLVKRDGKYYFLQDVTKCQDIIKKLEDVQFRKDREFHLLRLEDEEKCVKKIEENQEVIPFWEIPKETTKVINRLRVIFKSEKMAAAKSGKEIVSTAQMSEIFTLLNQRLLTFHGRVPIQYNYGWDSDKVKHELNQIKLPDFNELFKTQRRVKGPKLRNEEGPHLTETELKQLDFLLNVYVEKNENVDPSTEELYEDIAEKTEDAIVLKKPTGKVTMRIKSLQAIEKKKIKYKESRKRTNRTYILRFRQDRSVALELQKNVVKMYLEAGLEVPSHITVPLVDKKMPDSAKLDAHTGTWNTRPVTIISRTKLREKTSMLEEEMAKMLNHVANVDSYRPKPVTDRMIANCLNLHFRGKGRQLKADPDGEKKDRRFGRRVDPEVAKAKRLEYGKIWARQLMHPRKVKEARGIQAEVLRIADELGVTMPEDIRAPIQPERVRVEDYINIEDPLARTRARKCLENKCRYHFYRKLTPKIDRLNSILSNLKIAKEKLERSRSGRAPVIQIPLVEEKDPEDARTREARAQRPPYKRARSSDDEADYDQIRKLQKQLGGEAASDQTYTPLPRHEREPLTLVPPQRKKVHALTRRNIVPKSRVKIMRVGSLENEEVQAVQKLKQPYDVRDRAVVEFSPEGYDMPELQ